MRVRLNLPTGDGIAWIVKGMEPRLTEGAGAGRNFERMDRSSRSEVAPESLGERSITTGMVERVHFGLVCR
jgi:hypothetical protein